MERLSKEIEHMFKRNGIERQGQSPSKKATNATLQSKETLHQEVEPRVKAIERDMMLRALDSAQYVQRPQTRDYREMQGNMLKKVAMPTPPEGSATTTPRIKMLELGTSSAINYVDMNQVTNLEILPPYQRT